MSRNWCRIAARFLKGSIDFKTKYDELEFKAVRQNHKKSLMLEVVFDELITIVDNSPTVLDSDGLFRPSKIRAVMSRL